MDFANRDGHVRTGQAPAADDILRRLIAHESRETELEDVVDIADASIDYHAATAAKLCSLARELAEVGDGVIVGLAHYHIAGRDRAEHLQKRQEVVVARMPGGGLARDSERAAGQRRPRLDGLY